ncbi:MAG: YegP family protein [Woeseiaceae bacterium]
MAGKFELYKDKAGKFRFRLKAANGENVLASEAYESKSSCQNGIESVKKNSTDAKRFVKKSSGSGKFSFNLTAGNNQVIGTSQSYSSESGRDSGIQSVGKAATGAKVDDQT